MHSHLQGAHTEGTKVTKHKEEGGEIKLTKVLIATNGATMFLPPTHPSLPCDRCVLCLLACCVSHLVSREKKGSARTMMVVIPAHAGDFKHAAVVVLRGTGYIRC